jgi:hypothetical protein
MEIALRLIDPEFLQYMNSSDTDILNVSNSATMY